MSQQSTSKVSVALVAATAALLLAACGVEAVGQPVNKSAAEQIAEKFGGAAGQPPEVQAQPAAEAAAEAARKKAATDEAKRKAAAAAKRVADEKARQSAALAAEREREARTKADEAEMLQNAHAEAEQRRAELEQNRKARELAEAEAEQHRIAEAKAAEDARQQAAERERIADAQRRAEEQRLAEIKAAEQRRMAEANAAAEAKQQADAREREAEAQRQADLRALEVRREAEARLLAERLREAEAARAAKAASQTTRSESTQQITTAPIPASELPQVSPGPAVLDAGKFGPNVTVLVVMQPGNTGIRRFEKTADPVLCASDGCYISNGAAAPARLKSLHKVLGPGGTFGERAGACEKSLGCVFRNVDVARSHGFLQPVDMKVLVHDRREAQTLTSDSDCWVDTGALYCRRPIVAADYRMWVIPEALAVRAGREALEAAGRAGLPISGHSAFVTR